MPADILLQDPPPFRYLQAISVLSLSTGTLAPCPAPQGYKPTTALGSSSIALSRASWTLLRSSCANTQCCSYTHFQVLFYPFGVGRPSGLPRTQPPSWLLQWPRLLLCILGLTQWVPLPASPRGGHTPRSWATLSCRHHLRSTSMRLSTLSMLHSRHKLPRLSLVWATYSLRPTFPVMG